MRHPSHYRTHLKHNNDAVYWFKLSRARDQGLQFLHTKAFPMITYVTVPGDFIDRVISQFGDRVEFERLATPRSAPEVTLKSIWVTQQRPQQPILKKKVNNIWKQHATWESKATVRDKTKHTTEVELAVGNGMRPILKVDVGTRLSEQEVITGAHSKNEATGQEVQRVKIGSNKI